MEPVHGDAGGAWMRQLKENIGWHLTKMKPEHCLGLKVTGAVEDVGDADGGLDSVFIAELCKRQKTGKEND